MVSRDTLLEFCDALLSPEKFQDYCPNGLQIAGNSEIHRIVTGVSASLELLEAAVADHADAVLVHHGYFWRGEDPRIVGVSRRRIATVLSNDMNLIAYHLPLDAQPDFGNNAELGKLLGLRVEGQFSSGELPPLSWLGAFDYPMSGESLSTRITETLGRRPLHIPGPQSDICRVAWCTGAAQDFIVSAAEQGVDAFLTGEASERSVLLARELGVHFYVCGHHATERAGIRALGQRIAQKFGVSHTFIDIPNPI